MHFKKNNKSITFSINLLASLLVGLLAGLTCVFILFAGLKLVHQFRDTPEKQEMRKLSKITLIRQSLANQLSSFFQNNSFVSKTQLNLDGKEVEANIEYTIDPALQKEADQLLRQYNPDYGAIVVINASTGQILTMSSLQNRGEKLGNLALRATFPAASIFKIVTATAALDRHKVSADTLIMYNGGNHTLYKKNVLNDSVNRWTREITIREAFARSINTVFGKIALNILTPKDLSDYAIRFGFNKLIQSDLPIDVSFAEVPNEKTFHLSEIASGFNKVTTMSPIQGAMIAASVAELGVMKTPYIVEKIKDQKGATLFEAEPINAAVTMTPQGAEELKLLMENTITNGTSRKSFRPLAKNRRFHELELGGKTGSITGKNPAGKVDWFVGYAIGEKSKLAIAAITVNVDYWTVKSSYLAQRMIQKHFKEQFDASLVKY